MTTVAVEAEQCQRLLANAACTALGKGVKRGERFLAVVINKGKALRLRQGHGAAGLSNLVIWGEEEMSKWLSLEAEKRQTPLEKNPQISKVFILSSLIFPIKRFSSWPLLQAVTFLV